MDFDLTEEQKILKHSARSFLSKEYTKDVVRKLKESEKGYSPQLWRKMADLGWMGIIFPEEFDGTGGSFLDLIILAEEMGYYICPSPFLQTVVLGGFPILMGGRAEQKRELLPKIVRGEIILTMAIMEPNKRFELDLNEVKAYKEGSYYIIDTIKIFVPFAHVADYILCVVRTKESMNPLEGMTLFLVDSNSSGISLLPMKTIEEDQHYEVTLSGVKVANENIIGTPDQAGQLVEETFYRFALLKAAEMVGGAQAAMDMAMDYAKERIQFNVPIGSFQAVQFHIANMWMEVNSSRYLVYKAGWKVSNNIYSKMDVSMAKAHVGRACRRVTTLAHHIFAAISFTHEHDMHLYYRQALSGDLAFGNYPFHRNIVAEELGL
jgi:alkylation response protein AidB-like acyl-CoA dehydrogenase